MEARRPRDAAEIAKLDGVVDFKGVQKSKRIVVVKDEDTGMEEEHLIPLTKHLIVQRGDTVIKGQQLTDGLVVPQEILDVCEPVINEEEVVLFPYDLDDEVEQEDQGY